MIVAFRVDATERIGSGHVMRCLALAGALAERGMVCHFMVARCPGGLAERITTAGHRLHRLVVPGIGSGRSSAPHGAWLEGDPAEDAIATRASLEGIGADVLVLDHYALGAIWTRRAVPYSVRVVVIDDLADRPHHCDLLIDANLGRAARDYAGLVPHAARVLVGPSYALLRDEFRCWRERSLERRAEPVARRLLISLGGFDADDVTGSVLQALEGPGAPTPEEIVVVLTSGAPAIERVRARVDASALRVSLQCDVQEMAPLLASVDLAIGAAGGSAWERCCLGVPTLVIVLAANQRAGAAALAASGAAVVLGEGVEAVAALAPSWTRLERAGRLAAMSRAASALVDGHGLERVSSAIATLGKR